MGGPRLTGHGPASVSSPCSVPRAEWCPGGSEEDATRWVWREQEQQLSRISLEGEHRPLQGPNYPWQSSRWVPRTGSGPAPLPSWGALGKVSNQSGPQFPHQQNGDN